MVSMIRLIKPLLVIAALGTTSGAMAADAAHPTVVELFQSQGCSSCPPANANLTGIASRPDILALSFSVTYWDRLGWKDTFAQPVFTARQWEYAHALGHADVFTPQVVVNGSRDGVGANPLEMSALVRAGDRGDGGPALRVSSGKAVIGRGVAPRGGADIWLVRYDPRILQVAIGRGENAGRTLPHRDVVRELRRLGRWNGAGASIAYAPPADPAWKTAVLVQQGRGGPILAAARD